MMRGFAREEAGRPLLLARVCFRHPARAGGSPLLARVLMGNPSRAIQLRRELQKSRNLGFNLKATYIPAPVDPNAEPTI